MSSTTSLFELINKHLQQNVPASIPQTYSAKLQRKKQVKKIVFDNLFNYLNGPHRSRNLHPKERKSLSEYDQLIASCLALRLGGKYEEANQLDTAIKCLTKGTKLDDDMHAVLAFLLYMKDSQDENKEDLIGYTCSSHPVVISDKESNQIFPIGPAVYGKGRFQKKDVNYYMQYPSSLFVVPGNIIPSTNEQKAQTYNVYNAQTFECLPGKHKNRNLTSWMLGGLVQSTTSDINMKLGLPDLPELTSSCFRELKIPKLKEPLEDEGFVDTASMVSEIHTEALSCDSSGIDIWDRAMLEPLQKHFVWESVGQVVHPKEKPFLTEFGTQAFHEMMLLVQKRFLVLDPGLVPINYQFITMGDLVRDAINVLLAIPSHTFIFDFQTQSFLMREDICLLGTSPEGLKKSCEDIMDCGASYWRLMEFSRPRLLDSVYKLGLVFQGFTMGIRLYLQYYLTCILALDSHLTLMQLKFIMHDLMHQMKFITQLCGCDEGVEQDDAFPKGMSLISYLYNESLNQSNSAHYVVLLSLLHSSCMPYLIYLQDWMFEGICRDPYNEFMIKVDDAYLSCRERQYWSHGFQLVEPGQESRSPVFLSDLDEKIFVCGKSIHLLKLCCPEHYLFRTDLERPQLQLTFSEEKLKSIDTHCKKYVIRVNEIARQSTKSRHELLAEEEQNKHDLMLRARRIATQEIKAIMAHKKNIKQAQDAKKRQIFEELKTQMDEDLQRRSEKIKAEKEQDRLEVEAMTKQELLEAKVEAEVEKRARQDLIEYYGQLSAEAVLREQRALWRVQRRKLDLDRFELLMSEEIKLETELGIIVQEEEKKQTDHVSSDTADGKASADFPATILTSYPVDQKQRSELIIEEHGHQANSRITLPNWVMTNLPDASVLESSFTPPDDNNDDVQYSISVKKDPIEKCDKELQDGKKIHISDESSDNQTSFKSLAYRSPHDQSTGNEYKDRTDHNEGYNILKATVTPKEPALSRKPVKGFDILQETISDDSNFKPAIKTSDNKHVGIESCEDVYKPHLRTVHGYHSSKESKLDEISLLHSKMVKNRHVNEQTKQELTAIKKRNLFGHVSELSQVHYEFSAPKMKRNPFQNAFLQSDMSCFQIKPHRNRGLKTEDVVDSSGGRSVHGKHMSDQSSYVDFDRITRKKFQERNVHGHSSDSSVQHLLYGGTSIQNKQDDRQLDDVFEFVPYELIYQTSVEPYIDRYDQIGSLPQVDILAEKIRDPEAGLKDFSLTYQVESHRYKSLHSLLQASLTSTLQSQIALVNKSLLAYFQVDLEIEKHFAALRSFLFLQDGEFGQSLSDQLFEKLSMRPSQSDIFNPNFLGQVLRRSLQLSLKADTKYAANVGLTLGDLPKSLNHNSAQALDCLNLVYRVDWPLNIVINDNCLAKYNQIFSFLMQLKRVVWDLKDVWHRLKRDATILKAADSSQFRQLQLYRHEMEHFVKVMQGYISCQIIHVPWQELRIAMNYEIRTLDDLHNRHTEYLNTCIFRCLLNTKASRVMEIIQGTFNHILKFRAQLVASPWQKDQLSGNVFHPAFDNMVLTHTTFQDYSGFLFKVVDKLAARGYQPHLNELLLRLNFNEHYQS